MVMQAQPVYDCWKAICEKIDKQKGKESKKRVVYVTPQGEVFHLNKVRLASLPEGKKCSSWQELLEKVHPDLELVVNGETELIVRKK